MKPRFFRRLGILALGLILAGAAALSWLAYHPQALTPVFSMVLEKATGLSLTARQLTLAKGEGFTYTLDGQNVELFSPDQAQTLASLDSFSLEMDMGRFFSSQIHLQEIKLDGPKILFTLDEDQNLRLGKLKLARPGRHNGEMQFTLGRVAVSRGNLGLEFSGSDSLHPFWLENLECLCAPGSPAKEFTTTAGVRWGANHGKLLASGAMKNGAWDIRWELDDFPLDGLVIPGDHKGFDDLPVQGRVDASGAITGRAKAMWDLEGKYQIADAVVFNKNVPNGKVEPSELSGTLSLKMSKARGFFAQTRIHKLVLPYLTVTGQIDFAAPSRGPTRLTASGQSTDIVWSQLEPWLVGFLRPNTRAWLVKNIHEANCRDVKLLFDWHTPPLDDRNANTFYMDISTHVQDLDLSIAPKLPSANKVDALCRFYADHLTADFVHAQVPGGTITGGRLDLDYGDGFGTPLKINITGRADSKPVWDWARPLLPESGLLDSLALDGPAGILLAWELDDVGGKGGQEFYTYITPDKMAVALTVDSGPIRLTEVEGALAVDSGTLSFTDFTGNYGATLARAQGTMALSDGLPYSLGIQFKHMEGLLPRPRNPRSPIRQWLPKTLACSITIQKNKYDPKTQDPPSLVRVVASDDKNHRLKADVAVNGGQWKINQVSGRLGRLTARGSLGNQDKSGNLDLTVLAAPNANGASPSSNGPAPLHQFQFAWKEGAARAWASLGQLALGKWEGWTMPPRGELILDWAFGTVGSTMPSRPPFDKLDFSLEAAGLDYEKDWSGPFAVQGTAKLFPLVSLELPRFSWGDHHGNLSFQETDSAITGKAVLDNAGLPALAHVAGLLAKERDSAAGGQSAGPDKSRDLDLQLQVGSVALAGMNDPPLDVHVQWQGHNGDGTGKAVAAIGDQQLVLSLTQTPAGMELRAEADHLDLTPVAVAASALASALGPSRSSGSDKPVRIYAAVKELRASAEISGPFTATARVVPSKDKETLVELQKMDLWGTKGRGSLRLGERRHYLDLDLDRLNLSDLSKKVKIARSLSWPQAQTNENKPDSHLEFKFHTLAESEPGQATPLTLSGGCSWGNRYLSVDLDHFAWNGQKGTLFVEKLANRLRFRGDFEYLDLAAWRRLWWPPIKKKAEKPESVSKGMRVAFPFDPPDLTIEGKVFADRCRLHKHVVSDLVFEGHLSPKQVQLGPVSWKQDGKTAFSLEGNLDRKSKDLWSGKAKSSFEDLGDLAELILSPNADSPFPIEGGQTQVHITADLTPTPDGLWSPKGAFDLDSREGRILSKNRYLILLAALAPQNYLRALIGMRTELTGEGMVFEHMKADTTYDGSLITVSDFMFHSPTLRLVASGTVDAEKYTEDLRLCMQPFGTLNKIISYTPGLNWVLQNSDGVIFETCFHATGDIDDPDMETLPNSMVPTRLGDLFNTDE